MLPSFVNTQLLPIRASRDECRKRLTPLAPALTKNPPATPFESALPKSLDLKPFRIRTYQKGRGGGLSPNAPSPNGIIRRAPCKHESFAASYRPFKELS